MDKTKEERQAWWNGLSRHEQDEYSRTANRKWWDSLSLKQQKWIRWDIKKKQQKWLEGLKDGQKQIR